VVTVKDVAAYILASLGSMPTMKLQKLVYYSQAWSLVWDEAPLFEGRIEAWANGPVSPELYMAHRGQFLVNEIDGGNPEALSVNQKDTVGVVLRFYNQYNSQQLSDMTHMEAPWKDARQEAGLSDGQRGHAEITLASMAEYYSSL
jgi:uncharacterized phage-associated protein